MDNLIHADCLDAMAAMDAESIDAIVTDPPYGLGFMGKAWDKMGMDARTAAQQNSILPAGGQAAFEWKPNAFQQWCEVWAREAFRIAKPGAHLLAFGGTRTVHRLAAAIEDAGWEIRDMLVWGYASGFPKSLDVSKAIDRAAGAEREVVGPGRWNGVKGSNERQRDVLIRPGGQHDETAPATPDAEKWNGWGTALKPAWEPIVMARKPLRGTVASNVLRHGTGALNIDGTRIGTDGGTTRGDNGSNAGKPRNTLHGGNFGVEPIDGGRWPANVVLTDPIFDGGVEGVVGGGEQVSRGPAVNNRLSDWSFSSYAGTPEGADLIGYGDSGTYSRFFLIPKSARAEREPVLGGLVARSEGDGTTVRNARCAVCRKVKFSGDPCACDEPIWEPSSLRQNVHPTVKPLDLMRHLVRLVTPPGGTVLDPFLGSGTTALAAEMEGFAWIGIEKEAEYIAIAEARLNGTQRGLGLDVPAPTIQRTTQPDDYDGQRHPGRHWTEWREAGEEV